jgi:peptidoglycan hydrolase-like protein with peptidoglycan-binding domain
MADEPTQRYGYSGEHVLTMQSKLLQAGYDAQGQDGYFGDHTQAAVETFQRDKGLQVDGVCGNQTWAALNGDYSVRPGTTDQGGLGGDVFGPTTINVELTGQRTDDDKVHLVVTITNTGQVPVDAYSLSCSVAVGVGESDGSVFEQSQMVGSIHPGTVETHDFIVHAPRQDHVYVATARVSGPPNGTADFGFQ